MPPSVTIFLGARRSPWFGSRALVYIPQLAAWSDSDHAGSNPEEGLVCILVFGERTRPDGITI